MMVTFGGRRWATPLPQKMVANVAAAAMVLKVRWFGLMRFICLDDWALPMCDSGVS